MKVKLTMKYSVGFCAVYYFVWIKVLPRYGGYQFRQTIMHMDGGATAHKLVKVPNEQLDSWDATHDVAGRVRQRVTRSDSDEVKI